jgi:hypothetical protein
MKYALFLLVAALGADQRQKGKVNPVEKVTHLLEKIQKEIEEEGKAEAAAYDKYACFCKEQADNKQYAIEKFAEQIEVLSAKIEAKSATKSQLDADIGELTTEIGEVNSDQEAAQGIRDTENEEYVEREGKLSTAIQRMKDAIEALKAASPALIAKYTTVLHDSIVMADVLGVKHQAASLLQQSPAAYSSHSNEVISTLESLLKNFKQKKIECDNDEMKTRQEFEMASGARANQIKALEKAKSEKSAQSAALEQEINAHETEKSETEYSKTADGNFLTDLTGKCEDKSKNFDERSNTRTQELTAIAKALELLKGDVSKMYGANDLGLAQTQAKAEVPVKAPVVVESEAASAEDEDEFEEEAISFIQLLNKKPKTALLRNKVITYLSHQAESLNSKVLSTLLIKMKDTPSPFAKVKQMISDLITRLEEEAAAEADQKAWCDENMATATSDRDTAQMEIEKLNALMAEKNALKDSLAEDITTLSTEISDLTKGLNEETMLRETEKDENDKTLAESQAGLAAVEGAIEVLNAFYNPGSFIQKQKPSNTAEGYDRFVAEGAGSDGKTVDDMAPGAGDMGEYGGKKDASNSIIGLLEVIKSDFENTISKTTTDEEAAVAAYEDFKSETETSIGDKGTLKDTKTDDKTTAELDIVQAEADLKLQKEDLDNALDELVKLKPVCVDSGMSWEERTARREQEVESLKNALKILQETDFGFMQKH